MSAHTEACSSKMFYPTTGKWGVCDCGLEADEQAEQDALAGQSEAEQAQEAEERDVDLGWGEP